MALPQPADGEPRRSHVEHDGLRIAVLDWGGAAGARPVVLLHPNGFCDGLYDPIARRLAAGGVFRPVGIDLRGHGGTDKPPPPEPYDYGAMAGDVVAVLDAFGFDAVDFVGGSLGGGVALHVDRLRPDRVRRLMLCEPIAFPVTTAIPAGAAHPMAAGALRRKVVWPSREAMVRSYGSRPPLDRLAPEALAAY
ncbi:MAG TPA: alpha/beta fold hydrolase, partial [Acidimicrobiia bacterium]|nr:alpha/beta fold hydrolase [Acidimicrobiia bacterium]